MAFVPVDINSIKLDQASPVILQGGNEPDYLTQLVPDKSSNFIPVDISKIKFDVTPQDGYTTDPIRTGYQATMNDVAKPIISAGDRILEAISNVTPGGILKKYINDSPDGQKILSKASNYISDSPIGVATKEGITQLGEKADEINSYDKNGNLSHDLPAFLQNALLASTLIGAKPAIEAISPEIKGGINAIIRRESPVPITREATREASQNAYQHVDDSGTVINPNITNKVHDIIEQTKQKPTFNGKLLTTEQKEINDALSEYSGIRDQPMNMESLQTLDSTIGDKAAQAYVSGNYNKGRIFSDLQDKIRMLVQPKNLTSSDISGSAEGITALTDHAIPLWSLQSKLGDLGKIVERANSMANPAPAIQTGMRNLMLNKPKFNQYPKEVQAMIVKASKSGIADDLLGVLGSRLNAIAGGAVGGLPGEVAGYGISSGFRGIRNAVKNSQADAISAKLAEPYRASIEKYSNYSAPEPQPFKPAGLLPAPETVVNVDRYGTATQPISAAEREALGKAPASPIEKSLKEIEKMSDSEAKDELENFIRRKKASEKTIRMGKP